MASKNGEYELLMDKLDTIIKNEDTISKTLASYKARIRLLEEAVTVLIKQNTKEKP